MRKYLIVGGTSGIGLELVKTLSAEHSITVVSRTSEGISGLPNVEHITFDVTTDSFPSIDDPIDGVAYLPGSINLRPFHRIRLEDFQKDMDLNLFGAVKVLQGVFPNLKKSENASVVLYSTVAVQQGLSFHASISAAKGAIEGLTRSLAAEWSPNIRVNCVAPSIVNTPLASKLLSNEDKIEASAKRHPLNRVGSPKDIASVSQFLLSEDSSWITGQVIGVDGGMSSIKSL